LIKARVSGHPRVEILHLLKAQNLVIMEASSSLSQQTIFAKQFSLENKSNIDSRLFPNGAVTIQEVATFVSPFSSHILFKVASLWITARNAGLPEFVSRSIAESTMQITDRSNCNQFYCRH
jgi:hypothetical protein